MSDPLYVDGVIGYRAWNVSPKGAILTGRVLHQPWATEKPTVAECIQRNNSFWAGTCVDSYDLPLDHPVPSIGCSCGLHAYHDIPEAIEDYGAGYRTVVGAAVFWGGIAVHTIGFKAEKGRIVALVEHRPKKRDLGWPTELETVVARYNVPVVPYNLLREYAETFGKPLGEDYLDG